MLALIPLLWYPSGLQNDPLLFQLLVRELLNPRPGFPEGVVVPRLNLRKKEGTREGGEYYGLLLRHYVTYSSNFRSNSNQVF